MTASMASSIAAYERGARAQLSSLEGRLVDTQMAMSDAAARAAAAESEAIAEKLNKQ